MATIVRDQTEKERLIRERQAAGHDREDEVWDGEYILMPDPNIEHQEIASGLVVVFGTLIVWQGLGRVFPGVNVSDRRDQWTLNYRCPDVAVYLNGNLAVASGAYWLGGPDLAVEIVSPGDRSREKLDFYARVNVRELMFIDRDPCRIEIYQLRDGSLTLAGVSDLERPEAVASAVLPLTFRIVAGGDRPAIEVVHADGVQRWLV